MNWFFDDPAAVELLIAACESCLDTPFRFGSRAPGIDGGLDCTSFLEVVMVKTGAAPEFKFQRRRRDMSPHVFNERIPNYFRGKDEDPQSAVLAARFAELDLGGSGSPSTIATRSEIAFHLPGDIVILKTGKGLFHLLCMTSATAFMQCAFPDGVTEGDIGAPNYRKHLVAAFRARAL